MKRTILAFFYILVLVTVPLLSAQTPQGAPKMQVDQVTFDAGSMYRSGQTLDHAFVIKNNGNADLNILSATPGCGCTVTKFDKVVAPGAEGKVYASVDLSHFKGPIAKYVDVVTNDPNQNKVRLTLKADVKTIVDVRPADVVQLRPLLGKGDTQEVVVIPTYEKPITLRDASVDTNEFTVQMEKVDNPQDPKNPVQYKLIVGSRADLKVGIHKGEIKVIVDGGPQKELIIPVLAVVKGPISAVPPQVSFQIKNFPDEVIPTGTANVRIKPDATAAVSEKVAPGAGLKVITQQADWYQVITPDNKLGWISSKVVKGSKTASGEMTQAVSIQSSSDSPFKVLNVSSTLPQVKVVMDPATTGTKAYNLKVALSDRSIKGDKVVPGSIKVKTDNPDQPELVIPVYIDIL